MKRALRIVQNTIQLHARELARAAIKERLEKQSPRTNQHDSYSPCLLVDEVLKKAEPDLLGKK